MADEPDVSTDTISNLRPSKQIERNDGSEALEHALGNRMRRMCGQAWIPDTRDQRVSLKPLRQQHGGLLGSLYAQRERSGAANSKKGFERAWCRASQLARLPEGVPESIVFGRGDPG